MTAHHDRLEVTAASGKKYHLLPTESDLPMFGSNVTLTGSGSYNVFLGGTHDTVDFTGGNETVTAYFGNNTFTLGGGSNLVQIAGTGNVVDAGGGDNTISDMGSGNTIVLAAAGQGTDTIFNGIGSLNDTYDLRTLLAATKWTGKTAGLGNFLEVTSPTSSTGGENGGDAVLMARDSTTQAWSTVAVFKECGGLTLSTLLAHSIV